ncbi:MAG: hypothetical protein HZA53_15365 [Planctomycetes bacterium]|nr:hypothetical protein [Planctomycetota bacterium]
MQALHRHPTRVTTVRLAIAFLVAAAWIGPNALAQFTVNYVAPFHGAPCTQYAAWESFAQANLLPNPPDDPTTTSPSAAVYQLAAGGVITGAGNLDNLTIPPVYSITESVAGDAQEVVLQVCLLLNQMNWNSFVLSYTNASDVVQSFVPNTSTFLVHLMGRDERLITWDLSSLTDVITAYRIDFAATNSFTTLDAVKLDTRFICTGGAPFCAGDGLDPAVTVACPCSNFGALGHGCANSVVAAGATLSGTGLPSNDDIALAGSGMPATVACIYLQGDLETQAVFGDGVRCAGGTLLRLRTRVNSGGASAFPDSTDTITLSARGGVVPGSGATRFYQTYYRNSAPLFCPPETFNVTNGLRVTW